MAKDYKGHRVTLDGKVYTIECFTTMEDGTERAIRGLQGGRMGPHGIIRIIQHDALCRPITDRRNPLDDKVPGVLG
jgi:hypothetical protein